MRKSLLSVAVAATILSGCGGSDSDKNDDDGKNLDGKVTVQVIDGYLSNAEVCVDKNSNFVCDTGEALSDRTNDKGQVTLSASDSQYPLIARIIAGETSDSDHPGFVWQNAELLAEAGNQLLTPFSTLAQLNKQTLASYAAELNLDASLLSQDYVALKSTNAEAKKIHLYARTITKMLGETLAFNDLESQKVQIQALKGHIQGLENNNVDLDTVDLTVNKEGVVTQTERVKGLQTFLEGHGTLYLPSPNTAGNVAHQLRFEAGKITESSFGWIDIGTAYQVSDMSLSVDSQPVAKADFLYLSNDFALGYFYHDPSNKLLSVWLSEEDYQSRSTNLTKEDLINHTWYHLRDLAEYQSGEDAPPVPALTELTFISDSVVMVKPFGKTAFQASWRFEQVQITPPPGEPDYDLQSINIFYGDAPLDPLLGNEELMSITTSFTRGDLMLFEQEYKPLFPLTVIMTKNKALAEAIYTRWKP
ncbi:hypothetical protein [Photobacterium halotolerans]|uniref:Lipoprotein n=1 Tax=Photobacterium halotolerans TaxID=265726 RepID=A0A0F5VAK6_9GAMM|nr:hypothetical protein [Photobacterium halotolerans]KKC99200.1 hypothetical protein KY46_13945 [Photobacterium halotolerans]